MTSAEATPTAPVSWGELIDKVTILEIKRERIASLDAQTSIARELSQLRAIADPVLARHSEVAALKDTLKNINEQLWEIEDAIRAKEAEARFDSEFIALARSVYKTNDARGALKRKINMTLGSELREEKSYKEYPGQQTEE